MRFDPTKIPFSLKVPEGYSCDLSEEEQRKLIGELVSKLCPNLSGPVVTVIIPMEKVSAGIHGVRQIVDINSTAIKGTGLEGKYDPMSVFSAILAGLRCAFDHVCDSISQSAGDSEDKKKLARAALAAAAQVIYEEKVKEQEGGKDEDIGKLFKACLDGLKEGGLN